MDKETNQGKTPDVGECPVCKGGMHLHEIESEEDEERLCDPHRREHTIHLLGYDPTGKNWMKYEPDGTGQDEENFMES